MSESPTAVATNQNDLTVSALAYVLHIPIDRHSLTNRHRMDLFVNEPSR